MTSTNTNVTNVTGVSGVPAPSSVLVIYVLRLQEGKFFIGKTINLTKTIQLHKRAIAIRWTSIYPMIDVFETIEGDDFDEDKYVIKYMNEYGMENVRGGSFSDVILSMDQCLAVKRLLCNANNQCSACEHTNHTLQDCKTVICYRCGSPNHDYSICNLDYHTLNGCLNGCYRCGRSDHSAIRCNRSKDIFGRPLESRCIIM